MSATTQNYVYEFGREKKDAKLNVLSQEQLNKIREAVKVYRPKKDEHPD